MNKAKIRDKILDYYENVLKKREQKFCDNKEADGLIKEEPIAFLFGVILDQGAVAERVWAIPYYLKKIIGSLDAYIIANLKDEEIYRIFEQLPTKPRYWKTAARRIRNAALQIVKRYHGKAENIWSDNPKASDLQARFDSFDGIGQKKSSMATRILGMDLNVPVRNWSEIDISVDEMIRRVFPRSGLSSTDNPKEIIECARDLYPDFPGVLDYPCWDIGRTWCNPQNPICDECYIGDVCQRIGVQY